MSTFVLSYYDFIGPNPNHYVFGVYSSLELAKVAMLAFQDKFEENDDDCDGHFTIYKSQLDENCPKLILPWKIDINLNKPTSELLIDDGFITIKYASWWKNSDLKSAKTALKNFKQNMEPAIEY